MATQWVKLYKKRRQKDTLDHVKADILVDTLADTLAEHEADTLPTH